MIRTSIQRSAGSMLAFAALTAAMIGVPTVAVAILPGTANATVAKPVETMPIVVDGVRYRTLKAAGLDNATALSFVVDRQAQEDGVVYVFRNREEAQARMALTSGAVGTQSRNAKFWEHPNGDGFLLEDWPNTYRRDLTEVGRGCSWFWCAGDWNDVITSIQTNGSWVHAYEHPYTGGNMLDVAPFITVPDLINIGFPGGGNWNDKISSFIVGP